MSTLSREDKELILDFYFRCGTDESIDRGRDMIASNSEASKLYADLESSLQQLDSIKYEPCPDNLAEITIAKLKLAASAQKAHLDSLLAQEMEKPVLIPIAAERRGLWRNFFEIAAIAAMVLVVAGVSFPSLTHMRQVGVCKYNIKKIGQAVASYASDNNGMFPAVATSVGSPWWKVGDQGRDNLSNTRPLWLLAKKGYVDAGDFVCPERDDTNPVNLTKQELIKLYDFPSRKNLSYSFRFIGGNNSNKHLNHQKVIILADLNPIFENIFTIEDINSTQEFETLRITQQLLQMMSTSHRNRGQNVLYGDGSVLFEKTRIIFGDDIFTIQGRFDYRGCESPCNKDDTFLAP